MNTSQMVFLITAEELNFTKAAKRCFITQQALSKHIRKLENEYNVALFTRKPSVSLTPAGHALYKKLLQIQRLESNLNIELKEISEGNHGNLRLGLNSSRATRMLSEIFPNYHRLYPHVTWSIYSGDTNEMSTLLGKGDLDMLIGVDAVIRKEFHYVPLVEDKIYLIASQGLLESTAKNENWDLSDIIRHGLPPALLPNFPLCLNYSTSTLNQAIEKYLNLHQISLSPIIRMSNYDAQIRLCASKIVAAFFPTFMLPEVFRYNETSTPDTYLHVLSLKNLKETLRIDCIYPSGLYLPHYALHFIDMIKEYSLGYQRYVELFLQGKH
ncbi:LysR family transcriptional regulator [Hominifimenecus sp. rT4P-3]|uniref:LysR family transcriptional regulator n=1 Tax=Hominifimenecus sp. rT4P-3 TaxID=3242979 RepID=UPI003DA528E2